MRTKYEIGLEQDGLDSDTLGARFEAVRKNYSRGRSLKTTRRRSSRAAGANVPLGIAARRGRRWSW